MPRSLLAVLLLLSSLPGQEPPRLPSDLVGSAGQPTLAWRLPGIAPGADVVGFERGENPSIMIGGPRSGGEPPLLGDICLASPLGWGIRRIAAPAGLVGLPAMLRQVVLASDQTGMLNVWPLGSSDRDVSPWTVKARGPMTVGPLVVGRTLVFAGGSVLQSVSDLVEPRWEKDLGAPVAVPLASDGQTIFAVAGPELLAVDGADGAIRWREELPAAAGTGLLVTAGLVVAGFDDGRLRAYDAGSGELVWEQAPTESQARFAPHLALGGPWLFAAETGGRVFAVDACTGEPRWEATVPGPLGSPTIGFGRVFVIGGEGRLYALPLAAGQERWLYAPLSERDEPQALTGVVSIHGRRLYVTTLDGTLLALNLEAAGPVLWPVPGGAASRNGRVIPPEADEPAEPAAEAPPE